MSFMEQLWGRGRSGGAHGVDRAPGLRTHCAIRGVHLLFCSTSACTVEGTKGDLEVLRQAASVARTLKFFFLKRKHVIHRVKFIPPYSHKGAKATQPGTDEGDKWSSG